MDFVVADPPEEIPVENLGSKIIIDATKRWTYPAISLPPREHLAAVIDDWAAYGLPPLEQTGLPTFV
jgi:4-hydroxy-3-polyprenylbenzoate decarboxylase